MARRFIHEGRTLVPRLVCCLGLNWETFLPRSFSNTKRSDSSNLILTSMYTCHMDSRWCTLDFHVVITNLLTNQPTDWLTPWSRARPEKLTSSQIVHKFPTFYGTRSFISIFTSARHLSLAWARWIQSLSPRHDASSVCRWRSGLQYGGLLQIYWRRSRGQPTKGGLPTWVLGEMLITLQRQKWHFYQTDAPSSHVVITDI